MDETIHDQQTKELFARSENAINKSQMLVEFCDLQSKKLAELIDESGKLIGHFKENSGKKEKTAHKF